MSTLLKQSSTAQPLVFFMADSTDGKTGKTGLTCTVTISKSGGSFSSPAGAVSEIANGFYKVAGNATDTNTLGPLLLHATGTGADPADKEYSVVAFDPQVTYITSGTGTDQILLTSGKVSPADNSIDSSTPTSDFAPQIGGDILNLAAGDLINTNPNGVGNLIIATKTAVDALTTAVAAIPTTSGGGGTSGGNGFF